MDGEEEVLDWLPESVAGGACGTLLAMFDWVYVANKYCSRSGFCVQQMFHLHCNLPPHSRPSARNAFAYLGGS